METYLHRDRDVRSPEEIAEHLKSTFKNDILDMDLKSLSGGVSKGNAVSHLWVTISRDRFLDVIDELGKFDFPHFHITSGDDEGEDIVLFYHFDLYRAVKKGACINVTLIVRLPKSDLTIPSLFSRIPGVEYSEREIQEMLGIDHVGLPNKALVFLPDDWNREVFPWRRDETGPGEDIVNDLS